MIKDYLIPKNYLTTSYEVYKKRTKSSFELLDSIKGNRINRVYPHKLFCDTTIKNRCITHDDKNIFYDLIEKALLKTLFLKFSISIENFNKEKIKSISRDKGVDEKTISKIIQLIENCEIAKYSRSSNSIMNNDLNNATEVINLILKNKQ